MLKIIKTLYVKSYTKEFLDNFDEEEFYVNPTGNFVIGGPDGIVD